MAGAAGLSRPVRHRLVLSATASSCPPPLTISGSIGRWSIVHPDSETTRVAGSGRPNPPSSSPWLPGSWLILTHWF